MRVVTRHRPVDADAFLRDCAAALSVLADQPGFSGGECCRSPDEPLVWLLTTRWADVGSMRRGMGGYEAKVALAPVMASAADEPSVFEVLLEAGEGGLSRADSALAAADGAAAGRSGRSEKPRGNR